jgi:hypothetical protein
VQKIIKIPKIALIISSHFEAILSSRKNAFIFRALIGCPVPGVSANLS